MSTVRFNKLHFFKRFDPKADYVVLKHMTISGVDVWPGDAFDKSLMPIHKIKRLFETRKITTADSIYVDPIPDDEEETVVNEPVIVNAGPAWRKVMLGDVQIGKTVRTEDEALVIIAAWREENKE